MRDQGVFGGALARDGWDGGCESAAKAGFASSPAKIANRISKSDRRGALPIFRALLLRTVIGSIPFIKQDLDYVFKRIGRGNQRPGFARKPRQANDDDDDCGLRPLAEKAFGIGDVESG
jgi:hypothetical protein